MKISNLFYPFSFKAAMKSQDIHSGQDILAPKNKDGSKKKSNDMKKQYPC
jgi:hypothetical protein